MIPGQVHTMGGFDGPRLNRWLRLNDQPRSGACLHQPVPLGIRSGLATCGGTRNPPGILAGSTSLVLPIDALRSQASALGATPEAPREGTSAPPPVHQRRSPWHEPDHAAGMPEGDDGHRKRERDIRRPGRFVLVWGQALHEQVPERQGASLERAWLPRQRPSLTIRGTEEARELHYEMPSAP